MSFWIAAAALTIVATLLALLPMLKTGAVVAPVRAEHDVEVYGAQLKELSADLDRGVISPTEAASAKAEIGRRLLHAASEARRGIAAPRSAWTRWGAIAVVVVVPAVALGTYSQLGHPGSADRPLAARQNEAAPGQDIAALVAAAEERLRQNPEDGRGWELLAPIYARMGETAKAETAFRNAIRILGDTPQRQVGLGEVLAQGAGGEVTDEALAAFRRALDLDPAFLPAKFFVALDLSQEGRNAEALAAWQGFIAESPPDAPWLQLARSAVADAEAKLGGGAPVTAPGPTGEQVAAAAEMGEGDRRAMIEGMVTQLAARLQTAPNDIEGWKRLMRSYAVLGDVAKAREAYAAASGSFPEGSAERREIASFWQGLAIGEDGGTAVQ
ncbi:c-type cytochrome biogenesis protein CcmI [Antarcticirhabdus aurantiaca]|uniref:C-type cytochrome biogenesis protein CcmI n=1 Tax=Antarcticirhabdus aurantiaca TaxID=2606717 RepID=A0ACD4NIQ5_9HYPH|nr:c-type cytochrome biogenesis protein CcmI [Antarcticirhabdus aurantiaca]WAJ26684.1 c-type cytochrome biogenesis protein CcmI [Jeongeuplla avenae]